VTPVTDATTRMLVQRTPTQVHGKKSVIMNIKGL
jgi:hypothetical protein